MIRKTWPLVLGSFVVSATLIAACNSGTEEGDETGTGGTVTSFGGSTVTRGGTSPIGGSTVGKGGTTTVGSGGNRFASGGQGGTLARGGATGLGGTVARGGATNGGTAGTVGKGGTAGTAGKANNAGTTNVAGTAGKVNVAGNAGKANVAGGTSGGEAGAISTGGVTNTGGVTSTGGVTAAGGPGAGGAATGGAESAGAAGAAGAVNLGACPGQVQLLPRTVVCGTAGSTCSLDVNVSGGGVVTYDCTCSGGHWTCGTATDAACPLGVVTAPTTTQCSSTSDTTCKLLVGGAASFGINCTCSGANPNAVWSCL